MSTVIVPPAPRQPFVDRNGYITRPWSDYLLRYVFTRIGGGDALTNLELADQVNSSAQAPVVQPQVFSQDHEVSPTPMPFVLQTEPDQSGRIAALEALVAQQQQQINGLLQGYQV